MLSVSPATRIFVALDPVDMRKSFNGLYAHIQAVLQENPLSGHLFVYTNRLRNRVKLVWFEQKVSNLKCVLSQDGPPTIEQAEEFFEHEAGRS